MDPRQRPHLIVADEPFLTRELTGFLRARSITVDTRPPADVDKLEEAVLVAAATTVPFQLLEAAAGVLEPAFKSGLPPWAHSDAQLRRAAQGANYYTVRSLPADDALLAQAQVSVLVGSRHEREHYARLLGKTWRRRDRLRPGRRPTLRHCGPRTAGLGGQHAAGLIATLRLAATAASVTYETEQGLRTFEVRPLESGTRGTADAAGDTAHR